MIKPVNSSVTSFAKSFGFVLLTMLMLRIIFLAIILRYFAVLSFATLVKAVLYSVRIDLATLLWINGPILLIMILLPPLYERYRNFFRVILVILNGMLLLLSVCDNIYFDYTQRRLYYDAFYLIPQSFTPRLLLTYLLHGWYWFVILALAFFLYLRLFPRVQGTAQQKRAGWKIKLAAASVLALVLLAGIRGFGSRPLSPSSVLLYFPPKLVTLASNTGFNLAYSYYKGANKLPDKAYFSGDALQQQFTIYKQGKKILNSSKPNIVLFVMESFARDFLDSNSQFKAHTPFLDSIMKESLVFNNAFNNGLESTHGLVATLASLPAFMQVPYYHSQYHAVPIRGLGTILASEGYDCSFFLGDVDDSFGFREFTSSIGIKNYYSQDDFGDDRYYNGAWGIHDEPFFGYAAGVLNRKSSPFFATIYNVSSHPPYIIPEELKKQFSIAGQNAAQNSISYVDHAYRSFFKKVVNEPWFRNTVFIFIADHFLSPSDKKTFTSVNINEIPFFIYAPGNDALKGSRKEVVQQLDVVPTILQLAGYQGKFMSFGESVLAPRKAGYAVQKMGYIYQVLDSSYALGLNANNDEPMYLYNYKLDSLLKNNLLQQSSMNAKKLELENHLKAMIQVYNNRFNNNALYY